MRNSFDVNETGQLCIGDTPILYDYKRGAKLDLCLEKVHEFLKRRKNTTVRLLNHNNEELKQFHTNVSGKYRFELKKNKIYKVVATKKNLYGDTIVVSDKTLFRNERKDIIFQDDKTIQGYTVSRATGEIIPNVEIDINNGIRSKKRTIFSDEEGYYQFAFNNDSLLLLKGFNDSLFGLKEFFIDSNYLFKKQHNLELDLAF